MVGPRKGGFSQFGGLAGDLESGARKRQGLAEARRTAQVQQGRGRLRSRAGMRALLGCAVLAFFGTWVYCMVRFVDGEGSDYPGIPGITPVLMKDDLLKALFHIGAKDPGTLARILEEEDPLGVSVERPDQFECPATERERFSSPDIRDHEAEEEFKRGNGFIYYQHLRKAGGTGFCEMAGRNLPPAVVPMYHCMPDKRGSMATPPWSDPDYLIEQMRTSGHRITANEWDAFPSTHLDLPGAVFGTTFRHPVDRWYSQYRFEHIEHRDGTKAGSTPFPFQQWYKRMKPHVMGDNYYVKTFCGLANPPDDVLLQDVTRRGTPKHIVDLSWSYHKFNPWGDQVSWEAFESAVENLRRFNLILVLDFVDDEMWALSDALGWKKARKQVLPHEGQAVRADKKSISAREALRGDVWEETVRSNIFDVLLFHWAKRMYLERSSCRTMATEGT